MPKEDECLEDEVKEEFDMIDSNVKETEEEVSSSSDVIDHAIQSEEISNSYEDKVITNMEQEEKEQITDMKYFYYFFSYIIFPVNITWNISNQVLEVAEWD